MAIKIKKGSAPATGKVKPSRQEMLLADQAALAQDQLPERFTMAAITGEADRLEDERETMQESRGVLIPKHGSGVPGRSLEEYALTEIHRSPFQPKGRPSAAAITSVERAIAETSSLEGLMAQEGASAFNRLDTEAKRLAELAFDIQRRGITDPIEVRTTPDGTIECLRGHRRMAGAKLADLTHVTALNRGEMSNANAAATVLSGNLHRENFTTWQEAVLVTQVQEQRRSNNQPHDVRSLGAVMGWSHGKVQNLLSFRRALDPEYLTSVGRGNSDQVEDMLSHLSVADLGRIASITDKSTRTQELHRRLGWTTPVKSNVSAPLPWQHRTKRGGGFEVVVTRPIESLDQSDAAMLLEVLEGQVSRIRARIQTLNSN